MFKETTRQATSLVNIEAKLKAVLKPDIARKVEPDLEALLEAENLAMRPGPKSITRAFILEKLRQAIKTTTKTKVSCKFSYFKSTETLGKSMGFWFFTGNYRDEAIRAAWHTGIYTLAKTGDHFRLHYSWVSRTANAINKPPPAADPRATPCFQLGFWEWVSNPSGHAVSHPFTQAIN